MNDPFPHFIFCFLTTDFFFSFSFLFLNNQFPLQYGLFLYLQKCFLLPGVEFKNSNRIPYLQFKVVPPQGSSTIFQPNSSGSINQA